MGEPDPDQSLTILLGILEGEYGESLAPMGWLTVFTRAPLYGADRFSGFSRQAEFGSLQRSLQGQVVLILIRSVLREDKASSAWPKITS